jgi:hypothetical protein
MLKKYLIQTLLLFSTIAAHADTCGVGRITSIGEGRYNTNDFMITIDYSMAPSKYPGTEFYGLIVFKKSNLDIERFKGIKALAKLAFAADKSVMTYAHTGRCDDATEIVLYK